MKRAGLQSGPLSCVARLRRLVRRAPRRKSDQRETRVRRLALPVRLLLVARAAACFLREDDRVLRLAGVRPLARLLPPPSASMLSFLSAAFSSFRLALSRLTTLSCPSSSAQAINVP